MGLPSHDLRSDINLKVRLMIVLESLGPVLGRTSGLLGSLEALWNGPEASEGGLETS